MKFTIQTAVLALVATAQAQCSVPIESVPAVVAPVQSSSPAESVPAQVIEPAETTTAVAAPAASASAPASAAPVADVAAGECGAGTPDATVTGTDTYVASNGGSEVYSGTDYLAAIQAAIDSLSAGQRVAVMASGAIGTGTISLPSGITFEGCGTIDASQASTKGAIESFDTTDVSIPFLHMTGSPYFGLRFSGTVGLSLGAIVMELSGGMGVRFDRDGPRNTDVTIDSVTVSGAGSHAVEIFNIDGLDIGEVIARDCGECGLLLQTSTDARVGLVDGDNVAAGTGYATFRMANNNGQLPDGSYTTNIFVDKVVSRGGGRGVFCVSQSGGVEIGEIDLADNGNNAVLLENCYNVNIKSGTISGGGEVRVAARDEFPNNKDITVVATVDVTTVRESPCGENIEWSITGGASLDVC